jgi:hypothetical protein
LSANVGDDPNIAIKLVKNFTTDMYCTGSLGWNPVKMPIKGSLLFGRKISTNSTGFISYNTDFSNLFGVEESTCAIGMAHRIDDVTSSLEMIGK